MGQPLSRVIRNPGCRCCYPKQKAIRGMAIYASHALIPRGRRPCARREVLRTETGRSQRCPVRNVPGGAGKAKSRNPAVHVAEKSDTSVVPEKPLNKGPGPAEIVEERDVAKGNTNGPRAPRTLSRFRCASMSLEGVREAARRNKGTQFTALLHHVTPQLLAQSFYALRRDADPRGST